MAVFWASCTQPLHTNIYDIIIQLYDLLYRKLMKGVQISHNIVQLVIVLRHMVKSIFIYCTSVMELSSKGYEELQVLDYF